MLKAIIIKKLIPLCERACKLDFRRMQSNLNMNKISKTWGWEGSHTIGVLLVNLFLIGWIHCCLLDATTGASDDWAKGAGGVKYAYNPELRGPGFNPDIDAIYPSFEETLAAVRALADAIPYKPIGSNWVLDLHSIFKFYESNKYMK